MWKYFLILIVLGKLNSAFAAVNYREACKKTKYRSLTTINADFEIFACGDGEYASWTLGYWYKNSQHVLLPYISETDVKPLFQRGKANFIYKTDVGVAILGGKPFSFNAEISCDKASCRFSNCKLVGRTPPSSVKRAIISLNAEISKTKQDEYFENIHAKNIPQQLAGFVFLGNKDAQTLLLDIQSKFERNLDGEAAEGFSDVMTFVNAFKACY